MTAGKTGTKKKWKKKINICHRIHTISVQYKGKAKRSNTHNLVQQICNLTKIRC